MIRAGFVLAVCALIGAGCVRRPVPAGPVPHYVVGAGYQVGGVWYYPREDFHYDATGLASVLPDSGGVAADGEAIDPTSMTAAHQTLQLPSIVRVTHLETGRQVVLRITDRGPASPARLIGLSPRAAALLGVAPGGAAAVRVQIEEGPSTALREQMQGGPRLVVAAAPRGAVQSEALAPPPGTGQSARGRTTGATPQAAPSAVVTAALVPDRLPETVQSVPPNPGRLMIQAGTFGQATYANQVAARLAGIGGRAERIREGRGERWLVRAGPFTGVAAADAALDLALRAGVSDARISVE